MLDDDNDIPPSDPQMDSSSPPDILNDDSEPSPHEFSQPSSSPSDGLSSFRSTSPSSMPTEYSEPEPRAENDNARSFKPLSTMPAPKRPTVTGHKRQFKKLSTPFRTPQMKLPSSPPAKKVKRESSKELMPPPPPPPPPPRKPADVQKKHRTVRAAGQFKSPLTVARDGDKPAVRMTPNIQSLERKVQILKRALKVKNDGDEQILQDLAKQWTEAGREVAWQLWDIVKENGSSDSGSWPAESSRKKRGFEGSWGWEEQGDKKRMKMDSWGWDETPVKTEDGEEVLGEYQQPARLDDECEEKVDFTLGVMLRQFGIDPDTLGWNEEDGMFR
ncbi:hypothetical protein BDZ89DRAFT_1100710 [Hymenopellis radicata]|nr:hypothetical protein BDZ89DRAFT_1100710 [Hymenopellis radicata]